MNVTVTLAPGSPAKPEVGDVVKLQVFLGEPVGSAGDAWEAVAPPGTPWLEAGSVTVSTSSVRARPSDPGTTKLELEAMVHQPGALVVGPLQLRDQVTKAEVDVPPTTVAGTETTAGTAPKEEPPWIQAPVRFGGWDWTTLGIFFAVLLALAVTLGRYLWKRLQAHLTQNLTYTERALHGLTNLQKYLRAKKPLAQEEWKSFSFELAGILRRYCDRNFHIDSMDMTDREFLAELRSLGDAAAYVQLLSQILGTITEVRYGRKELDASVIPGLLLDSRKFVESTTKEIREETKR